MFDSSRATANAGNELPVVRGEDFRSDEILLLDVPVLDPNFRVHLRVYAPEGVDGTRVRLEVLDPATTAEMIVTLSRPDSALRHRPSPLSEFSSSTSTEWSRRGSRGRSEST